MDSLDQESTALAHFLLRHPKVAVLTGAGISQASGIPTYRDSRGHWLHSEPIKHQEFVSEPARRKRYWARSMRGWPRVRDAMPNRAHQALARLEQAGHVQPVITQNVDRLHQRAGHQQVIDLHGRLDRVQCLDCGGFQCRNQLQNELTALNSVRLRTVNTPARPDGDADLSDDLVDTVQVPGCRECGGTLMPDVVFFGGTVPRQRVDACMAAVEEADALLVIGSSLQVFSGFRFCRRAAQANKPIAIMNPGVTRADDLAAVKWHSDCGALLSRVIRQLGLSSSPGSPS
jgi:NAD-dependent SIR2 family protein deacetylase